VLAEQSTASPKARTGVVESIRVLRITRATAVKARTQALLQIRTLIVSAPDELRDELLALKPKKAAERCLTLYADGGRDAGSMTRRALRTLARRVLSASLTTKSPSSRANCASSSPSPLHGCSRSPASAPNALPSS